MSEYGIAAEFVGIHSRSSHDGFPASSRVDRVPAGVAHAFDREAGRTLCGAPVEQLVVFGDPWRSDAWTIHCPLCGLLADDLVDDDRHSGP